VVGGVGLKVLQAQRAREGAAWTGEKGRPSQAVPARLRFAVVAGGDRLDHGQSGAVVPAEASLAFRVEVGRPAHLALLRLAAGETEVVWKGRADRAGTVDVSEDGHAAAYPLRGLSGTQRFALVASERPIAQDDLAAAARAATGASAGKDDPRLSVMTLDVVEVTIR
jgi:hypothetical protein